MNAGPSLALHLEFRRIPKLKVVRGGLSGKLVAVFDTYTWATTPTRPSTRCSRS